MADVPYDHLDAIRRYRQDEPASTICRALGRTRYWPHKWLKCYDPANPLWTQSH
jgi:hypothetical protein